ncbi:hypothetical protein RBB50_010748 [Rhinocladiella similis]
MADLTPHNSGDTVEIEATAGPSAGLRKRKATSMDTAKLMRKRATDRRSQQAFRERTKLRIAALEDEVAKASQTTAEVLRELRELTLERDNLNAECLEWKDKAKETMELHAQIHTLAKTFNQLRTIGPGQDLKTSSLRQGMFPRTSQVLNMRPIAPGRDRSADHDPSVQTQSSRNQEVVNDVYSSETLILAEALSEPKKANRSSHELSEPTQDACISALPQSICRGRRESFLTDPADFDSVCFQRTTPDTSPRHGGTGILQLISKDPLSTCIYDTVELCTEPPATGLVRPTGGNTSKLQTTMHPGSYHCTKLINATDVSAESSVQASCTYNSSEIQFQRQPAGSLAWWPSGWGPTSSIQVDPCEQLPHNLKPLAPGDRILQNLVSSLRSVAAGGVPWDELLGPELPCWKGLVAPIPSPCSHTICQAVFDIVKAYTGYSGFPEKVSSAYIMYTSVTVGLHHVCASTVTNITHDD